MNGPEYDPETTALLEIDAEPAEGDPEKKSQATRLVELAQAAGDELFSSDQTAYARVAVDAHLEVHALRSRGYRSRLARRMYEAEDRAPGSQATQDAISVLEGMALYAGDEHPVHVRLAEHEGAIYLDLGAPDWRAIEITAEGWELIATPPVRFRRPKGLAELPEPARGDLGTLAAILNVSPDDWPLVVGWLLAALRPTGPYPVLALHGEHGSAKSTTARMLRSLIDPRTEMLRSPPRSEHDLVIGASNGWIVGFDNLSSIPPWLSDGLCRLATGGGFATRTLYADDEETIFSATRPILVNGIGEIATRGDLVDRTLMVEVPRIAESQRLTEGEVWKAFNAARPAILGALLDAVAVGLRDVGEVELDELPRMADFATWAVAALPGAGISPGVFLARYSANRAAGTSAVLEDSPLAGALFKVAADGFEGSASELLERLGDSASEADLRSRDWPKGAAALGRLLGRLAPTLRDSGVEIEHDRSGSRRTWHIRTGAQSPVTSVMPSQPAHSSDVGHDGSHDGGDGSDGSHDGRTDTQKPHGRAKNDGNDGNDGKSHPQSDRGRPTLEEAIRDPARAERIRAAVDGEWVGE